MHPAPRLARAVLLAVAVGACLIASRAVAEDPPPAPGAGDASAAPEPAPAPRRLLLINSFGREFTPYAIVASAFRTELASLWPGPIEFLEVSLETVRFEGQDDEPVVDYIATLCAKRRFDLVVTNGAPAARFWLRQRDALLPGTPSLLAAVEERHRARLSLQPGDHLQTFPLDLAGQIRNVLALLPQTRDIVVVVGTSPLEKFWIQAFRAEWKPFEGKVRFLWYDGLPFDEILRRVANLPPRTAIFFATLQLDAAGVPYAQEAAVDRLRARANAPIFSWCDNLLGHGIVGGPLTPVEAIGRAAAREARRLLAGEPAGAEPDVAFGAASMAFDWRELRRFGISESLLPPGSRVEYQPPSLVRTYRWPITIGGAILVAQGIVIAALLVARYRRRQAEEEARRLRQDLAHAGRVSVVGQMASSLAHELNQPLGAILRNAEAAELLLAEPKPDLDEVRSILADIRKDDLRAGGVIDGVRTLLRRHGTELAPVELDAVIAAVGALVRSDAQARHVTLTIDAEPGLPPVRANQVQLQQVLLNLMFNGLEAMEQTPEEERTLRVAARAAGPDEVELLVGDSGPGIPVADLPRIFDNFYTTKTGGMGMGLAICARIVAAHGGRIEAINGAGGGATFRVVLPAGTQGA